MLSGPFATARILSGPTGSGKSEIALEVAERLGAEIVSMDSMALYRGMDVGTAKPTADDRRRVPHHLIDVLDPWESANVAWWLRQAAACCTEIRSRGKVPLIVGGTPLYLKAILFGIFEGAPAEASIRRRLEDEAHHLGSVALHQRLAKVDSVSAGRIHPNDARRIVRALEVHELTGRPLSDWQQQWSDKGPVEADAPAYFWIDRPRAELYERIERRVDRMFAAGFVDEVRRLRSGGHGWSKEAAQALGYREVSAHLDGRADLRDTIAAVKTHSRQFAKRQLTWFRNLPGGFPIGPELTGVLRHLTMEGTAEAAQSSCPPD